MRKSRRYLMVLLLISATAGTAFAQTTVSGTVKNSLTQEPVAAVSVTIKGTGAGTFTDEKGFSGLPRTAIRHLSLFSLQLVLNPRK